MPTQKALFALSKEEPRIKYRKLGYEGMDIGTYVDYSVWATTDTQETQGYRTSAANAVSSVMAACLGMLAQGLEWNMDINLNLQEVLKHGAKTTVRSLTTKKPTTTVDIQEGLDDYTEVERDVAI